MTLQDNVTRGRVLAIVNVDTMADLIVKPWLRSLQAKGYVVHVACSNGPCMENVKKEGFETHVLDIRRKFNPLVNIRPIFQAWRLIRKHKFGVVNTHSPIGAAVGRIAARLAGVPAIVYTVHGFYFHDNSPFWARIPLVAIEWLLGRVTTHFMFVSEEDRQTALRTGIAKNSACTTTIYNAVNSEIFKPALDAERENIQSSLGIAPGKTVIGIVGRIVKEKGYREFASMAQSLLQQNKNGCFLVIGDSLASDRDRFGETFRKMIQEQGMSEHFIFTGFTSEVPRYLQAIDIFVLPSYREGFPKSVLEAMSSGLPVVATDIRGSREAVVHGQTGLIVPPRNAHALSEAVSQLVDHPEKAKAMGVASRTRVLEMYDERILHKRFVGVFDNLLPE